MDLVCTFRVEFRPGGIPGQLATLVNVVAEDGTTIVTHSGPLVSVGSSLILGPVRVAAGTAVPAPAAGQSAAGQPAAGQPRRHWPSA